MRNYVLYYSGARNQQFYIKPETSGIHLKNLNLNIDGGLTVGGTATYNISTTGSIFGNNLIYNTGINNISGTLTANNLVYNTGNQTISGIKTFANDINVSGTGIFNGLNLENINNLLLSGMNINITGNSTVNVFNPIRISGNQVLTGVTQDSRAVLTTTNQTIAGIKTFSTEIVTNLIDGADTNFTNALPLIISGGNAAYPYTTGGNIDIVGGAGGAATGVINLRSNTNINGNLNVTGNIKGSDLLKIGKGLDVAIFGAYGLFTSEVGENAGFTINRGDNSSYASLDFLKEGDASFGWSIQSQPGSEDLTIVDRVNSSNLATFQVGGNVGIGTVSPSAKLHVSGGDLKVDGNIYLSGNSVLTGVDLSSYATNTNLASTGSTLQTNINNLSGYINSTGSNIVFTTGNQTISGNKTFTNNLIYSVSPRTSGTTFTPNADLYTFFDFVLTGNSTLNAPTNMVNGESITIFLNQDSSGSRSMSFNSAYLFSNGITPTLNFVPSGVDIMQVIRVNNRYFTTFASNY